jgi:general secretion pathway protein E/type IV pilus assembly protein PilB
MAQRLVRRVCPHCRFELPAREADIPIDFDLHGETPLFQGAGCRECRNTGYRGRIGVYELLTMTDPIRQLVMDHANAGRIAEVAAASGDLTLLRDAAIERATEGVTTVSEAMRVTKG